MDTVGSCRLFCYKKERRRRNEYRNPVELLDDLVLIGSRLKPQQWVICHLFRRCSIGDETTTTATSTLVDMSDAVLGYSDSVQVTFSIPSNSACNMEDIIDIRYAAAPVSSKQLATELHFMASDVSAYKNLVKLSSLDSLSDDPVRIATPKIGAVGAISIVCAVRLVLPENEIGDGTLERHHLLRAALKRQLVGSVIGFSNSVKPTPQIRTALSLPFRGRTVTYTVTSVVCESYNNKRQSMCPSVFFWILPSTRVTLDMLEDDDEEEVNRDDAVTFFENPCEINNKVNVSNVSSVARYLIDIMTGVFEEPTMNLSRSLLLTGPPGVGKTHAVRQAIRHFHRSTTAHLRRVNLLSIRGSEIMSSGCAAEAAVTLQVAWEAAAESTTIVNKKKKKKKNAIVIIFLDECEALVSNDTMSGMLAYLLDRLSNEWKNIVLLAATNRVDDIPTFLRRPGRLDKEIPIAPPTSIERQVILQSLLDKFNLTCGSGRDNKTCLTKEELREIAEACVGFVPADLDLVVRHAVERLLLDHTVQSSLMELLKYSTLTVGASALRDAANKMPPTTSWDDIAGDPGGAKTALRQAIEWPRTKREAFDRLGLSTPRGILLYGPPGCAKSSLARAAAAASSVTFLSFAPADVYASSYVGDAEAMIRRSFALARSAAPCILFFDEIDAIVGHESNNNNGPGQTDVNMYELGRGRSTEARVLSTFLNEMDGVDGSSKDGVLVLGATNRPWTLDAALMRPGRFDKIIYVPPPDEEGRRRILEMQCKNWQNDVPFDFAYLASNEISGGLTGAEILGACHEAAMSVFSDATHRHQGECNDILVTQSDLERSLLHVQPSFATDDDMRDFITFENCRNRI